MKRAAAALRQAALFDIPAKSRAEFRALAAELDAARDWESIARALLVKHAGRQGVALIGSGTLKWARERVELRIDRDGDAIVIHWDAPPLKPEGV